MVPFLAATYFYIAALQGQLAQHNVYVLNESKTCQEMPDLLGAYLPDPRLLLICESKLGSAEEYLSVLKHESIHVIQTCGTGTRLLDPADSKMDDIDKSEASLVRGSYDPEVHDMEAEARYYGDKLTAREIISLLSKACKRSW